MRFDSTKVKPLGGAARPYPDHRLKNEHERHAEYLFAQSRQQRSIAQAHVDEAKYDHKGFFGRHMAIHKANRANRKADKFANKALKQWKKGDAFNAKHSHVNVPREPAPFSSHGKSPLGKWNGIDRSDWTHDDYH